MPPGFRRLLPCLLLALAPALARAAVPPPPNFVIVLADDLGWGDPGFQGGTAAATPHLDRLAREGLRFTDFHSNGAVCSPTRAALLTGRYPQRAGIPGVLYAGFDQNRHHGLFPVETTLAEALQGAGHATGVMGKWHLGYDPQFNPLHHGFDVFHGYVSGNIDYQAHLDRMGVADWWDGRTPSPETGYSTHLITRHAIRFLEQHRDRPFLLFVAHQAPHDPYQGPDDPPFRVAGRVVPSPDEPGRIRRAYGEMLRELDRGVGELVATLERLDLTRQTLVFFCSDNGATRHGRNAPWRGHKGSLWEGGHRVPAVAWWPGRIPPGTCDVPATTLDLMPTLLDLAGVARPAERRLDGQSLREVLLTGGSLPSRRLFWEHQDQAAVREGPWKLLVTAPAGGGGDPRHELFHLADDPGETRDRAAAEPERVAGLAAALDRWRADVRRGATRQPD